MAGRSLPDRFPKRLRAGSAQSFDVHVSTEAGSEGARVAGTPEGVGRDPGEIWVYPVDGAVRREGWLINRKRVYRLYKEEGLELRTKKKKKRPSHGRVPLGAASRVNEK